MFSLSVLVKLCVTHALLGEYQSLGLDSVSVVKLKNVLQSETFLPHEKWKIGNVGSAIECSIHCKQDLYCVSCLFSKDFRTCVALRSTYEDALRKMKPTKLTGYSFYVTQRSAPTVGSICNTDNDCLTITFASCNIGKCRCKIGFSLDARENRCRKLSKCRRFSNKFEKYEQRNIISPDRNTYILISIKTCLKKCLKQRRYTCKSVDYDTARTCYLKSDTWLDVKPVFRKKPLFNHYQRLCRRWKLKPSMSK